MNNNEDEMLNILIEPDRLSSEDSDNEEDKVNPYFLFIKAVMPLLRNKFPNEKSTIYLKVAALIWNAIKTGEQIQVNKELFDRENERFKYLHGVKLSD